MFPMWRVEWWSEFHNKNIISKRSSFFPGNLCTFGQTSVMKEMQYSTKCPNVSVIIFMKSSKKQFSRTEQMKEAVFTLHLVKSNLRHSFNKQTAQCGVYMPLQKLKRVKEVGNGQFQMNSYYEQSQPLGHVGHDFLHQTEAVTPNSSRNWHLESHF